MFSTELLSRASHPIEVERSDNVPRATAFQRWKHSSIPNPVAIDFSHCGKARMERLGDKAAPQNTNGWRQESVQRRDPTIRLIAALRQIHMGALGQSMDARVGSPGAMDPDGRGTDGLKSLLQLVLDRVSIRLALPAGKRGAVVGNNELEPGRHLFAGTNFLPGIAVTRALQSIKISLQDHLRRHLIDDAL